ncbi:MAG: Sapep family Mn(2+)-dependent dipeptidase [Clostridia bacterium]|nr:Sapep family Mn(2+)-dependent dipeptidase [Clostridia bacterium]
MDQKVLLKEVEEYIKSKREEYIADLGSLIEIESVGTAPDGKYVFGKASAEALDKMIEIGNGYGFKTENHDYYCASLVYGEGQEEMGIIAHLDVVPAGDGWTYPPYKLTVENELLIGRGTEDDKGPAVAGLYALRFFKDKGIKLPFALRLLMGGDEERGMNDLPYFLKSHKAPFFSFTPDSEFPVCTGEKGIGKLDIKLSAVLENIEHMEGGTVTNAVAGKAYAIVKNIKKDSLKTADNVSVEYFDGKAKITAMGKTAHAAQPEEGESAIALLASYLLDNIALNDSEKQSLSFMAEACGEYLGNKLNIAESDELMGYLTCVGGLLKTVDGALVQNFNIRFPRSGSWSEIKEKVTAVAASYGGTLIKDTHSNGYCFSPDKAEIVALTEACALVTGKASNPYTMGGGTYARSFPNTVAFGSTIAEHRGLLGEGRGKAHDRDEYLSVAEFEKSVEIFVLSIAKIAELKK